MKIVCDSCGAKYSIADEKVAGKVFKIRCKKCGATIVVRGDQDEDAATRVADVGGSVAGATGGGDGQAVWHAVVGGDQQGPFTAGQLAEMMTAGTIDWESYVWREGFDNWLPARDVPELVTAISGGGAQEHAGASAAASPRNSVGSEMGADPFATADSGGSPFAAAPEPARPTGGARRGGGDLFAQAEAAASPFGGSGDDDDGVVASAPSPRVSAQQASLTGQRNENSVLFSLANLQALATGGPSSSASTKSASPSRPGMASGEGSGLIDIRALASASGLGGASAAAPSASTGSAKKDSVDDLLSIGTGGSPFGASLAAPVLAPVKQEESSNKGLILGIAVGGGLLAVAAAIVVAVVVSNKGSETPQAPVADPTAIAAAGAPGAAVPGAAGIPSTPAAPSTVAPSPVAEPIPTTTAGTTPATGEMRPATTGGTVATAASNTASSGSGGSGGGSGGGGRARRGGGDAPSGGGGGGGGNSGGGAATAAGSGGASSGGAAAPGGGTKRPASSGGSDIDSLLNAALGGGGSGGARSGGGTSGGGGSGGASGGGGGDENLPQTPDRSAVMSALSAVQPAVSACGEGQHGLAMTEITVSGPTGRVTNAVVTGQFAGTPVGGCVARAVRGARFPRFRQATFTINYPFRI